MPVGAQADMGLNDSVELVLTKAADRKKAAEAPLEAAKGQPEAPNAPASAPCAPPEAEPGAEKA